MKAVKYLCFLLGIVLALSNIGGLIQGFGSPLLWILMIVFLLAGFSIGDKDKK